MTGAWRNPFLRYPRTLLALTALLCLPLLWRLTGFRVDSETEVLLRGDQRNLATYQKVRDILGEAEVIVVSIECDEVFSAAGIDAVRRIGEAFLREPDVADVKSLTHSYKPVRRGFSFDMVPFVPDREFSPEELAELKRFSLQHPLVRNVMVSPNSRHALLTVNYRRDLSTPSRQRALREEIDRVLAPFRVEGLRIRVLALALIEEEIRSTLARDLLRFVPGAAALLLLILWLTFRSWRIVLIVLAAQSAVLLLLPGLVELLGYRLNVFNVLLFPLVMGIHLALLAHLFTGYQVALARRGHPDEALAQALSLVLKPSVFALVTTGAGLLSLAASGVSQTREFGILGAAGLALVFGITFGPTLAALLLVARRDSLAWVGAGQGEGSHSNRDRVNPWTRLTDWTERRRTLILAVAVAVVAVSLAGLARIRTDIRAVEFLGRSSPTREAIEELDRVYGGVNVVQIEIDSGAANGVNALPFLRYMDAVHQYAASQPELSGVYSYAQLIAMINELWEGEAPGSFRLPDNPWLIGVFVLALQAQASPFLTTLADPSFRVGYLVLRTQDMPASRYLAVIERVVDYARTNAPPEVGVSAAAGIHSILEADRRIIRGQVRSAALTLGAIGLALLALWRSVRLMLICLVVNAVPIGFMLAAAGWTATPLNSITVMVGAIALGIGVDNSIHLITLWRDLRRGERDPRLALAEALRVKGRPILWASAILIAVFGLFWFSSFPPVVHFGLLAALAFLGALAAVLLLLPAVLGGPSGSPGAAHPANAGQASRSSIVAP